MDQILILFWVVAISTFSTFIAGFARRPAAQGWVMVTLTLLVMLFVVWWWRSAPLLYLTTALWVVFVVVPGALGRKYHNHLLQQQYDEALSICRAIAVLHPFDGWREMRSIVEALKLAHRGEIPQAVEILKQFQHVTSYAAQTAMINLYRITNRWEEFLAWVEQLPAEQRSNEGIIQVVLRARGETGDLRGMIDLYRDNRGEMGKLPAENRDFCRLMLFAFSGRRDLVERLFSGPLALLPDPVKAFWVATAQLTGGQTEVARRNFETLLQSADPSTRRAIERRLSFSLPAADSLDAAHAQVVEEAAVEHSQEEVFQGRAELFSRRAIATQILVVLNVIMFLRELRSGALTDRTAMIHMGALYPPAVQAGEWWRLITSLFLHGSVAHIVMNMLCLWAVGPYVESAFGSVRFVLIYLIAGMGSMFMVTKFGSGPHGIGITVGASGSIMALIGAIGGLALLGWFQHRATAAKEQFQRVVGILLIQMIVDATVPQISSTAHIAGAIFGFILGLIVPNRLTASINSGHTQPHS